MSISAISLYGVRFGCCLWSPRDNKLWVSESSQIMDEGEASCISLNINVGELQPISTMTQWWKKITCPLKDITYIVDISMFIWVDRWMTLCYLMTLVPSDTCFWGFTKRFLDSGSEGLGTCHELTMFQSLTHDLCCLLSLFSYVFIITLPNKAVAPWKQ